MKKISVYIASPYTLGDVARNVQVQLEMSDRLINLGFAPYAPLFSHFQHMFYPLPYETWLEIDFHWIEKCDCLLRLPGTSSGADREVDYATQIGLPIFYSVEELVNFYQK